jgi:hypothetical protein
VWGACGAVWGHRLGVETEDFEFLPTTALPPIKTHWAH